MAGALYAFWDNMSITSEDTHVIGTVPAIYTAIHTAKPGGLLGWRCRLRRRCRLPGTCGSRCSVLCCAGPPGPKQVPTAQQSVPASKAPDDGYDGYYNDVLPIDSSELPEQMDPALMKQIIILLAGAAAIIALAIILMTLL